MHALHENTLPFINGGQKMEGIPGYSDLAVTGIILGILVVTTIASLMKDRQPLARAEDGGAADPLVAAGDQDETAGQDRSDG